MSRFVHVDGIGYVNMNKVRSFCNTVGGSIHIEYENGEDVSVKTMNLKYQLELLEGHDFVVQVIPCNRPIVAVHTNNYGGIYVDNIDFLCLCADGMVKGLWLNSEGWFEVINECNLHYKDDWKKERTTQLKQRKEELLQFLKTSEEESIVKENDNER